eukprot:scaffold996_cov409-Prasinococcus_capsulatus_cf.AAC.24
MAKALACACNVEAPTPRRCRQEPQVQVDTARLLQARVDRPVGSSVLLQDEPCPVSATAAGAAESWPSPSHARASGRAVGPRGPVARWRTLWAAVSVQKQLDKHM